MSPASTPLIEALKQCLRNAGVSDDEISKVPPVHPEPSHGIIRDDQCMAVALARRLREAHRLANTSSDLGACRFTENGLSCLLNTTAADHEVISAAHGGGSFSRPTGVEQWVPPS
jgi:hypothetical protein